MFLNIVRASHTKTLKLGQLPSQDLDSSATSAADQRPATTVNPDAINEVFSEMEALNASSSPEPRVTRSRAVASEVSPSKKTSPDKREASSSKRPGPQLRFA